MTAANILAATLFAAKDLRVVETPLGPLPPDRVRLRFRAGGICGSDLHYYLHGRSGPFELKEPLTLGHEFVGEVAQVGAGVQGVAVGDRIAVDPSLACRACRSCREGRENLCANMRYYGSASVFPHVQGGFREAIDIRPSQCVALPEGLTYERAVFAEPLAVTLQAVSRAGPVLGRSVLVTGCGPIGALTVATLKAAGAAWISVTDLIEAPLAKAAAMGADETLRVGGDGPALGGDGTLRGRFDVAIEASGSAAGLQTCLDGVRAGGVVVQLGNIPGTAWTVALQALVTKELDLRGSFRFNGVFGQALKALADGRIVVDPLLTARFPLTDAQGAFELALDRNRAMKVQLFAVA
jgi:L-idonate 5-dehydrogenase